jgi:hypothetical protein
MIECKICGEKFSNPAGDDYHDYEGYLYHIDERHREEVYEAGVRLFLKRL